MHKSHVVEQSSSTAAPAGLVFDALSDVSRWPQHCADIVHTEQEPTEHGDLVSVWAVDGPDSVRRWNLRRTLDRSKLRITVTDQDDGTTGEWSLLSERADTTKATVRHDTWMKLGAQLTQLCAAAGRAAELDELIVDFDDPLFVGGAVEDAWEILYQADKWPQRLPHVLELKMTEDVPGVQFLDMLTTSPDGARHTHRSVRICLPHKIIAYKQIKVPPLLDAHTGRWTFTETPEGVLLSARHTATINPAALHLLGSGTTVAAARRYLRRVLGNNSMANMRLAKENAEARTVVGTHT